MKELIVIFWHYQMGNTHDAHTFLSLLEQGFTVEECCHHFGLTIEQYNLLKDTNLVYYNIVALYQKKEISLTTVFDDAYPSALKEMYFPPIVLACKGDLQLLTSPAVTFVSEDNVSYYAGEIMDDMCHSLKNVVVVLSILFDSSRDIYEYTQKHHLNCILVLASGLDKQYPMKHLFLEQHLIKHGLIISEYPLGMTFSKVNLLRHRQLVVGLSIAVCLVECEDKSAHLLNAYMALEQNKEVIVPPHNLFKPNGSGANLLIQQGARMYLTPTDLKEVIQENRR